ncbi:unnamed protein product, partial [marine sediment metagenome]
KITDIAKKRIELVGKAREGRLSLEEISNGTFTVTNLGMYGIRSFSPIINPPQAAILAVGEIYTEPAVVNGKIKPESFIDLSVSCDHRIIDGIVGAKFLGRKGIRVATAFFISSVILCGLVKILFIKSSAKTVLRWRLSISIFLSQLSQATLRR